MCLGIVIKADLAGWNWAFLAKHFTNLFALRIFTVGKKRFPPKTDLTRLVLRTLTDKLIY